MFADQRIWLRNFNNYSTLFQRGVGKSSSTDILLFVWASDLPILNDVNTDTDVCMCALVLEFVNANEKGEPLVSHVLFKSADINLATKLQNKCSRSGIYCESCEYTSFKMYDANLIPSYALQFIYFVCRIGAGVVVGVTIASEKADQRWSSVLENSKSFLQSSSRETVYM